MTGIDIFITRRKMSAATAAPLNMVVEFWSQIGWLVQSMKGRFHIQINLVTRLKRLINGIRRAFKIISTTRLKMWIRWRELSCKLIRFQMIYRSLIRAQWSIHLMSLFFRNLIYARRVRHAHGCQLVQQWGVLKILNK